MIDDEQVWSLGALLFECLTFRLPFAEWSLSALVSRLGSGELTLEPQQCPPPYDSLDSRRRRQQFVSEARDMCSSCESIRCVVCVSS